MNYSLLIDAVTPIGLAIPFLVLLVVIAIATFGVLWLIAYLRKRNKK